MITKKVAKMQVVNLFSYIIEAKTQRSNKRIKVHPKNTFNEECPTFNNTG